MRCLVRKAQSTPDAIQPLAPQHGGHDRYPVQIPVHDAVVYGGMLTRKDFPYPEIVQEHLVDRAGLLILEKFGR